MRRLVTREEDGAAIIEFALLAPLLISFLIGVLQIALLVQTQNAMRSVASDTARYAIVEYQKKTPVTDAKVRDSAEKLGKSPQYQMANNFSASVDNASTQRVDGALEKTITVTYTPPAILPLIDFTSPKLSYSRPIFLIDE